MGTADKLSRRWAWSLANEHRLKIRDFPGLAHCGAHLFGRPTKELDKGHIVSDISSKKFRVRNYLASLMFPEEVTMELQNMICRVWKK